MQVTLTSVSRIWKTSSDVNTMWTTNLSKCYLYILLFFLLHVQKHFMLVIKGVVNECILLLHTDKITSGNSS